MSEVPLYSDNVEVVEACSSPAQHVPETQSSSTPNRRPSSRSSSSSTSSSMFSRTASGQKQICIGTDRPALGQTGSPRDKQARLGTDRPASGHTGPLRDRQARLGTDRPASGVRNLHEGRKRLDVQGYLAHKKYPHPPGPP